MMNSILTYCKDNWWQLLIFLILGIFLGIIINYLRQKKDKDSISRNIENTIMSISFVIAAICLIINIVGIEEISSIGVLSFYSSFIFSWLLTKKSSKGELKETQHEIAKMIYRHVGDVREATLITQLRLKNIHSKGSAEQTDIEGIMDNISIIVKNIENIEQDWFDMLSDEEKRKKNKEINPEVPPKKQREVSQPDVRGIQGRFEQQQHGELPQAEQQEEQEGTQKEES